MIFILYLGCCLEVLPEISSETVDLIFADPPYFLSNDGLSINSGKVVSVNKGDWDKKDNYSSVEEFTHSWLKECYRVLKNNGSIWVSGTAHNIFDVREAMMSIGFNIINIVIWEKTDPPPLIYRNKLRFSYEFIIWGTKGKNHFFNYDLMFRINQEELTDVWKLPAVSFKEKKHGKHPTQKPEILLERIILACSKEGDTILDPFLGSGTTCAVACRMKRKYIGIEKDPNYYQIAERRIKEITLRT